MYYETLKLELSHLTAQSVCVLDHEPSKMSLYLHDGNT